MKEIFRKTSSNIILIQTRKNTFLFFRPWLYHFKYDFKKLWGSKNPENGLFK